MPMDSTTDNRFNVRTLNYLGSKFRLLDFIEDQVGRLTERGGGVCDLFAGSGCVSYKLSAHFAVTACDIQYYSAVLCHALLHPQHISEGHINSFLIRLQGNKSAMLEEAFSPLVKIESDAISEKNLEVLADITEHGSTEVFSRERSKSSISHFQERVLANLATMGIGGKDAFISRNYGGVYFSYLQAIQIDEILSAIKESVPDEEKSVFLAALLSTASDIVDTVGKHFAQPIKVRDANGRIKPLVYSKAVKDKTIDVKELYGKWLQQYVSLPKGEYSSRIIQGDYLDCLKMLHDDIRTVYADPPYTRDHYSRFYHVLETIARGDAPELATINVHGSTQVSNGLYREDRHQSPFCIRSKAPLAFEAMFKELSSAQRNLLLSYSPYDETKKTHPRVVTMKQLVSLAKQHFRNVDVVSAGKFAHNKLNSAANLLESSDEAELLVICTGGRS